MVVKTLKELAEILNGKLSSEKYADLEIKDVSGLDAAERGRNTEAAATFAENAETLKKAEALGFSAVIIPEKLLEAAENMPAVSVSNPRVSFAELLNLYYPRRVYPKGIHPSSQTDPSAKIDPSASIGPLTVIEAGAVIEAGCELLAGVKIGENAVIKKNTRILPNTVILNNTVIGEESLIGPSCSIGPDAHIGNDTEIGARCRIGACTAEFGCRFDNMADIQDGVHINPLSIVISQSCVKKGAQLGKLTITAGQALIGENITIGDYATIAARSNAQTDIPAGQNVWSGDPAIAHKSFMRSLVQKQTALKYWNRIRTK